MSGARAEIGSSLEDFSTTSSPTFLTMRTSGSLPVTSPAIARASCIGVASISESPFAKRMRSWGLASCFADFGRYGSSACSRSPERLASPSTGKWRIPVGRPNPNISAISSSCAGWNRSPICAKVALHETASALARALLP